MSDQAKLFLTFDVSPGSTYAELGEWHARQDFGAMERFLADSFGAGFGLRVLAMPRLGAFRDDEGMMAVPAPDEVEVVLDAMPAQQAQDLLQAFGRDPNFLKQFSASADPVVDAADVWCPANAASPLSGDLDQALGLIGAEALAAAGADGTGVHVVIVDQGLDRYRFVGNQLEGPFGPRGWTVHPNVNTAYAPSEPDRRPGEAAYGHGTKIAQLVLQLAPQAKLYDLPLLPDHIHDFRGFLSLARTAMLGPLLAVILHPLRRWVLCNAWSVYSLAEDAPPGSSANYGHNPDNKFTRRVRQIAAPSGTRGADVVFAAGNCGLYCPDGRCGPDQIGPGNSIYGVAALPEVLTVGAVRNDRTWIGYSSEGPEPSDFSGQGPGHKPDLCAPSQFVEPSDALVGHTGTSTACALAAGAVAALRGRNVRWRAAEPSTGEMIALLRATALRVPPEAPNDLRRGDGTLDLRAFAAAHLMPAAAEASADAEAAGG